MLDPDFFRQAAPAAARVTQSTIFILVSAYLGSRLDLRYDTSPWLFFAGLALGSVMGLIGLLRGIGPSDDEPPPPDPPQ